MNAQAQSLIFAAVFSIASVCAPLKAHAADAKTPMKAADTKAEKKADAKAETKKPDTAKGAKKMAGNPTVIIETTAGTFEVELDAAKAPITVENFLKYVDSGFYSGTIFHRVIKNFMIQGGGFTADMSQKPTQAPIKTEASNGLKNDRGTIAMARTNDVNSATAQFFINAKNNDFLNYPQNGGYTVFGKVTSGLDALDKIEAVKTTSKMGMGDVPESVIEIKSVKRK